MTTRLFLVDVVIADAGLTAAANPIADEALKKSRRDITFDIFPPLRYLILNIVSNIINKIEKTLKKDPLNEYVGRTVVF